MNEKQIREQHEKRIELLHIAEGTIRGGQQSIDQIKSILVEREKKRRLSNALDYLEQKLDILTLNQVDRLVAKIDDYLLLIGD